MPYMPDPDRYLCKDIRKTAPPSAHFRAYFYCSLNVKIYKKGVVGTYFIRLSLPVK